MNTWQRPLVQDSTELSRNCRTRLTYPGIALGYGHDMPNTLRTGHDAWQNIHWANEATIVGQWIYNGQDTHMWNNENSSSSIQRTYEPTDLNAHATNTEPYYANIDVGLQPDTYKASLRSTIQPLVDPSPSKSSRKPRKTVTQPEPTATMSYPQIGAVYCTGGPRRYLFKCNHPNCGKTFQRSYELERHYTGLHAPESEKEAFWCPQEGCSRSEATARSPFFRKDKMRDHLRNYHRIDVRRR
ncbi:hypothetical protein IQ07DRAFT_669506 [Pyrenochaeta sp. DS3sAY3a]|nr:hypothetical protein IQ07DRAFT_669506 [Pyrenochaeta sp. DS3sAY3a]